MCVISVPQPRLPTTADPFQSPGTLKYNDNVSLKGFAKYFFYQSCKEMQQEN